MGVTVTTDFIAANAKGTVIQGPLAEILSAPVASGCRAYPSDVTGTYLEMGADGLWTGATVGTLTQGQADALVASGAMGKVKTGTLATVGTAQYMWNGSAWAEVGKSIVATKKALVRKIAGALAGLNSLDIVFCGDSTTAGETVSGTQKNAFPAIIQKILGTRNYGKLRQGWIVCGGTSGNPNWIRGTWDSGIKIGIGGISKSGMIVSGFGAESWDVADVVLAKISGGGTVTTTATGGTPINTNVLGGDMIIIQPQAASASPSNSVEFSCSGSGFVMAVRPRLSTENAIRIGNLGAGGSKSADWGNTSTTGGIKLISTIAADILYVSIGANDAGSAVPVATYIQNMTAIANNAPANTQLIFASPIRSQNATIANIEAQYAAALKTFAATRGIPYHDLGDVIGDFDAAVFAPDGLHPNALGHAQLAQSLQNDLFGGIL